MMILYNDSVIKHEVLNSFLAEKLVSCEGVFMHQGERALRYKFNGYKYPKKYYRAVSSKLKKEVLERDGHRCRLCGDINKLEIDHIYAWSSGGLTEYSNLQTLCRSCNARKKNK